MIRDSFDIKSVSQLHLFHFHQKCFNFMYVQISPAKLIPTVERVLLIVLENLTYSSRNGEIFFILLLYVLTSKSHYNVEFFHFVKTLQKVTLDVNDVPIQILRRAVANCDENFSAPTTNTTLCVLEHVPFTFWHENEFFLSSITISI